MPPPLQRREATVRDMTAACPRSTDLTEEEIAKCARLPFYASPMANCALPDRLNALGRPADYVIREVQDQHTLDFNQKLNTSSYVNVVFEKEEEEAALLGLAVNLADQTVYTQSFTLHNNVVNMVANLWHCPRPDDYDEYGGYPGAGTVGSTEACLLAGLALKFRWRKWYGARHGLSASEVRAVAPNLVISTQFQAAWEKLFKYMDIEPKFITPSIDGPYAFKIDPAKVAGAVDEKTIGVVCILGNHYGGHYDPVAEVDAVLQQVNAERGFQLGIHVDAASGGFIAPFQDDQPAWDFRVPSVLSISASGHKFGESCAGTGWVVWRRRKDLSEHVAISVSYLGGKGESYTLNFSRPASGVYVQFYKFLRLGMEGYRALCDNMMSTASFIRTGLKAMRRPGGEPLFRILDDGDKGCLPVVTAMLDPALNLPYDDIDLQHALAQSLWYVSGYAMNLLDPISEQTLPLFHDAPGEQTMFRIVVKSNLTRPLAVHLLQAFKDALSFLDMHADGFKKHDSQGTMRDVVRAWRKKHHGGHSTC